MNNRMIKKIACAVMAFTLIAGVFTGCKTNKANKNSKPAQTVAMPSFTSVKDQSGELAVQGTVGDMEYTLLTDEQMADAFKKYSTYGQKKPGDCSGSQGYF